MDHGQNLSDTMTIAIVDYGMGNLRSVSKALEHLGADARVTHDPVAVRHATAVILPGVGAFGAAMRELSRRGLVEPIVEAIRGGRPYLGICLGLQLLFASSQESPGVAGLGILPGTVRRFPAGGGLKIPHMGWNQATVPASAAACPLLAGIPNNSFFYFVHSYFGDPADRKLIGLETDYGVRFTSMVWRERLFATQFHPEKSQTLGLHLLRNFVALA